MAAAEAGGASAERQSEDEPCLLGETAEEARRRLSLRAQEYERSRKLVTHEYLAQFEIPEWSSKDERGEAERSALRRLDMHEIAALKGRVRAQRKRIWRGRRDQVMIRTVRQREAEEAERGYAPPQAPKPAPSPGTTPALNRVWDSVEKRGLRDKRFNERFRGLLSLYAARPCPPPAAWLAVTLPQKQLWHHVPQLPQLPLMPAEQAVGGMLRHAAAYGPAQWDSLASAADSFLGAAGRAAVLQEKAALVSLRGVPCWQEALRRGAALRRRTPLPLTDGVVCCSLAPSPEQETLAMRTARLISGLCLLRHAVAEGTFWPRAAPGPLWAQQEAAATGGARRGSYTAAGLGGSLRNMKRPSRAFGSGAFAEEDFPPQQRGLQQAGDTHRFGLLFGACRAAAAEEDTLLVHSRDPSVASSRHITVAAGAAMSSLEVLHPEALTATGQLVPLHPLRLRDALHGMLHAGAARGLTFAASAPATAQDRDSAAAVREHLRASSGHNAAALADIERGLFHVAVDAGTKPGPGGAAAAAAMGYGRELCAPCWWGKALQLVVFGDGNAVLLGDTSLLDEHTVCEAAAFVVEAVSRDAGREDALWEWIANAEAKVGYGWHSIGIRELFDPGQTSVDGKPLHEVHPLPAALPTQRHCVRLLPQLEPWLRLATSARSGDAVVIHPDLAGRPTAADGKREGFLRPRRATEGGTPLAPVQQAGAPARSPHRARVRALELDVTSTESARKLPQALYRAEALARRQMEAAPHTTTETIHGLGAHWLHSKRVRFRAAAFVECALHAAAHRLQAGAGAAAHTVAHRQRVVRKCFIDSSVDHALLTLPSLHELSEALIGGGLRLRSGWEVAGMLRQASADVAAEVARTQKQCTAQGHLAALAECLPAAEANEVSFIAHPHIRGLYGDGLSTMELPAAYTPRVQSLLVGAAEWPAALRGAPAAPGGALHVTYCTFTDRTELLVAAQSRQRAQLFASLLRSTMLQMRDIIIAESRAP